jgi:hypothetical protein
MANVKKFSISRFDGDNQGFQKSRARSPLASRSYSLGNTHLQYSKLSPGAVLVQRRFHYKRLKITTEKFAER